MFGTYRTQFVIVSLHFWRLVKILEDTRLKAKLRKENNTELTKTRTQLATSISEPIGNRHFERQPELLTITPKILSSERSQQDFLPYLQMLGGNIYEKEN